MGPQKPLAPGGVCRESGQAKQDRKPIEASRANPEEQRSGFARRKQPQVIVARTLRVRSRRTRSVRATLGAKRLLLLAPRGLFIVCLPFATSKEGVEHAAAIQTARNQAHELRQKQRGPVAA